MINFYYNLIINNLFKFIFITLLFVTIQIGYELNKANKSFGKNELCVYYNKLITYDVKFYEYLRAINLRLERQEEFNYINDINATFFSFIKNLEDNFILNLEKKIKGNVTVTHGNEPLEFRISILNDLPKTQKGFKFKEKILKQIEKQINDIFFLTYDEFAFDSIFSLVPIPRSKFFAIKPCNEKIYHYLDKIFYQLLISMALSFCLIIFKTQLKKNPKLKKNQNYK